MVDGGNVYYLLFIFSYPKAKEALFRLASGVS
ncbi:hypothetical protein BH10BAC2_BH10BAC2_43690 [soil metagenome]